MKKLLTLIAAAGITLSGFSQETGKADYAYKVFNDTRVVNSQSTEMDVPGELKFLIQHRFASWEENVYDLFGLDGANIRFGFEYGFNDWLTLGFGRSSMQKTYDGFVKARILRQQTGKKNIPVSLAYFGASAIQTLRWVDDTRENLFSSRLFYSHQLLVSRKFSDRISAQVMPTLVHRNLVATRAESNQVYSVGGAFKYQLSKAWAVNLEYFYNLENQLAPGMQNPIALGFDWETKGHVFQFHLTNAQGMIESQYITMTSSDVLMNQIHMGFNISRDFVIRGRKYK